MNLVPVMLPLPTTGMRVIVYKVDRLPDFEINKPQYGIIQEVQLENDGKTVHSVLVKLDKRLQCLDEWNNCVQWLPEHAAGIKGVPISVVYDFWNDCQLE